MPEKSALAKAERMPSAWSGCLSSMEYRIVNLGKKSVPSWSAKPGRVMRCQVSPFMMSSRLSGSEPASGRKTYMASDQPWYGKRTAW